jgi:hypoxanthine phosphoribosyltransferase
VSSKIKGVILSIEDTLFQQGKSDSAVLDEVGKLINFFKSRQIDFVIFTNRNWTMGEGRRPLKDALFEKWGRFTYLSRADDSSIPPKPRAAATQYVLDKMGWTDIETVYVGASENDMRTAVNGNLLFLRATWYANKTDYGFEFSSPKEIARFIDTFCLRDHLWFYEIRDGDFSYNALAPFSTMRPEYTPYSSDARATAKYGLGHLDFWVGALVSSLYFSGMHKEIDYISGYPGHQRGSANVMDEAMAIFGKCFRKRFLPDLIQRHTTATKMQTARNNGVRVDHTIQLDSINLTQYPQMTSEKRFKSSPLGKGKTVLLIDDFCTRGYSLEAARVFIEQTGAKSKSVTWLKTINSDIERLGIFPKFDPYGPNAFLNVTPLKSYSYRNYIVDQGAPFELGEILKSYLAWDWPSN